MKITLLFSLLVSLMISTATLFLMVVKYHYYAVVPIPASSWIYWIVGNASFFFCACRLIYIDDSFDYRNSGDEILLDPHEIAISQ